MENGAGEEGIVDRDKTDLANDVVKIATECKEVTELESKTTTFVVQSERSHLTTSTLSTEPVFLSDEPSPSVADGSSDKPSVPQEASHPVEEEKPENAQTTESVEEIKSENAQTVEPVEEVNPENAQTADPVEEVKSENAQTVEPVEEVRSENVHAADPVEEVKSENAQTVEPVEEVKPENVHTADPVEEVKSENAQTVEPVEEVKPENVHTADPVEEVKSENAQTVEPVEEVKPENVHTADPVEEVKSENAQTVEPVEEVKPENVHTADPVEEVKSENVQTESQSNLDIAKEVITEPVHTSDEKEIVQEQTTEKPESNAENKIEDINEVKTEETRSETAVPNASASDVIKIVADIPLEPEQIKEEEKHKDNEMAESNSLLHQSAEIQEENIKNQLHEIIKEIDYAVGKEEDGVRHHTWKPKGQYEIKRTPIKYEEIVPVDVPEVTFTERQPTPLKREEREQEPPKQEISLEPLRILRQTVVNGEPVSPLEIPVGIPLLARILPRTENEEDEPREKIPLERLFTPATDAEEVLPQKKKKAFASSCFYRPDHPTIDDQVELAHKISVSLIDENNKSSKGQTMYMKRKNRSSKWVHQAAQYDMDEVEDEKKPSMEKPPLKLLLNPKGMQDYGAVQRHYEELLTSAEATQQIVRMEVGMEIASNLESPTGKGAALFAKRKKRMDKFIVDETTVQQQQLNSAHEEMTNTTSEMNSTSQSFSSTTIQDSSQLNNQTAPLNGPTSLGVLAVSQKGNLQLPDLTQILTQPKSPEKTTSSFSSRSVGRSKTTSTRSRSADSKPLSTKPGFSAFISPSSQKPKGKTLGMGGERKKVVSGSSFNVSSKSFTGEIQKPIPDPLISLRPGSPPVILVPDGTGGFVEKQTKIESSESISATTTTTTEVTTNNEGGAIYTAEVKVVQKPSLPTTPIIDFPVSTLAHHSILDELQASKEEEKRKSFNLAAKGWGTYTTYYKPIHLGAV